MGFLVILKKIYPIQMEEHLMVKIIKRLSPIMALVLTQFGVSCSPQVSEAPTAEPIHSTSTPTAIPPSPTPTVPPTPTSVPDVEGTVQIWLDWNAEEIQALAPHLTTFREMFPLVQVEISYYTPGEILEKYRQAISDGNPPDILIGRSDWGRQLYAEGYLRSINDRIPPELIEIIYPVAWDSVRDGNSYYGLPLSIHGVVLYRNPELVSSPAESLEMMNGSASDLEEENALVAVVELGFLYTGAYFSTCEGEFLDVEGELSLTHKAVECWLRLLETFSQSGSGTQNTDFDMDTFLAGESAWLVEGSWRADEIISKLGRDRVAIDPWPLYAAVERPLTGYAWTRNIYFHSSIANQDFDAAWVFARYLLTEEVQTSVAQVNNGRQFPVLSDLNFEAIWLQDMMNAMQENIALPREVIFSFFSEELEPAAFDVVRRGYDPYWITQWAMSNIVKALTFRSGELQ
jgi:ABC-type glycerol-3-phosphate transport system substrate-binding protein